MLRERGFTLIELLASLAVMAGLAVAGVPSFASLLQHQRIDAVVERLDADLAFARNTAIARRQSVIVCPRGADGTCAPGLDWSGGWVVAVENPRHPGVAADILWVQAAPAVAAHPVQVGATRPLLRYRLDGSTRGSNLTLHVCHAGLLAARHSISNAGRVRRERVSGEVPCPV